MENNGKGCISRDYNGCLNIKKIFNSFMKDGTRPQRYCRGYDLIKNTNTLLKVSNGIRLEDNSIIQIVQLHHWFWNFFFEKFCFILNIGRCNNMKVETLHPNNLIAKLFTNESFKKMDRMEKNIFIKKFNKKVDEMNLIKYH